MLACKNQKPAYRVVTQSGGINEKPRQHRSVTGYPLLLTASFTSILGGPEDMPMKTVYTAAANSLSTSGRRSAIIIKVCAAFDGKRRPCSHS